MNPSLLLFGLLALATQDRMVSEQHAGFELKTDLDGAQKEEVLAVAERTLAGARELLERLGVRRKGGLSLVLTIFSHEADYEDHRRRTHDQNTFVSSSVSYLDESGGEIAAAWQDGSLTATGQLRRQVARHVLREHAPDAPIWFEEGFAGYFEGLQIDPYGGTMDLVNEELLSTVRDALRNSSYCPLFDLMDLQHVEFYGLAGARKSDWPRATLYAESWSLLFYLLSADDPDAAQFLNLVVRRLSSGRWSQTLHRQLLKELEPRWIEFLQADSFREVGELVRSAWVRLEQGEYFAARMDAAKALELDRGHRSARRVLARAAYGEEDYVTAANLFQGLVDDDPNDLDALLCSARALLMLAGRSGDRQQTLEAISAGVTASRAAPIGKQHLGLLIAVEGAEQMQDLKQALELVRDILRLRGVPSEVRARVTELEQALIKRSIGRSKG
ncbi:MAG: hypothetical protein V2A76_04670 [Planctomycetota bacterium]